MNYFEKINKIERKLARWEKDLNPRYDSKVKEFFGRLIRKLESGVQKIGYFLFITHKWETKQERHFAYLKKQYVEIKPLFLAKDLKVKDSLLRQIKTMISICDVLLQKNDKISERRVYSFRGRIESFHDYYHDRMHEKEELENTEAFWDAIKHNNIENIQRLMNEDLVNQMVRANFPIHEAARLGHLEIAEALLPLTKKNCRNKYGKTPLHIAAEHGQMKIVEFLLEKGANPNTRDNLGRLPFHSAAFGGDLDIVKLLKQDVIDIADDFGRSALFSAIPNNHKHVLEYLIQHGADPNLRGIDGLLPLHYATSCGVLDLMELFVPLLKFPDDINVQTHAGVSVLSCAARNNRAIVEFLLRKGARIDLADKEGKLPIHFAAENRNTEAFELLIPNDINVQDAYGRTALSFAAQYPKEESIKWLLEHEADKNIPDKKGRLPFHYAAKMGYSNIQELAPIDIDIQDNKGRTALSSATYRNVRTVRQLLELGANENIPDKQGNLPLHRAALNVNKECLDMLSDFYKDIDVKGQNGRTALSFATVREDDDPELIELLLQKGAKAHLADKDGNTPLHYIASTPHVNMMRSLINNLTKEQIHLKNIQGKTAYMLAEEAGQNEILQELDQALEELDRAPV